MIFRCFKTQKPAHGAVQDADCHMSLWSQWSPCSSPCHGIWQRVRRIAALAQGNGKSCDPFGRHLGDTLMGWRWGKSWENLGRVYEHVHHVFIICSSYVHHMFIGSPASCGRTPMVGFVIVSTIEVATAVGKWEQSIRLRTWEDPAKSESLHSQNLESTCNTAQC